MGRFYLCAVILKNLKFIIYGDGGRHRPFLGRSTSPVLTNPDLRKLFTLNILLLRAAVQSGLKFLLWLCRFLPLCLTGYRLQGC